MDKTVLPGRVHGSLRPPCSKSYAQRALAASLLASGRSVLRDIDRCDDTLTAIRCIETLGARVAYGPARSLEVDGGLRPRADQLDAGESGLAMRLFTPIAALLDEPFRIEGRGTLLGRSTDTMAAPLRQLGVRFEDTRSHLPLRVCGPMHGGEATVDGSLSSQFLTGLLLALPATGSACTLHVEGAVSTPYLDITVDTASRFGVEIHRDAYAEFYIPGGQRYRPADYRIESDWSAAAMMLVAGAIAGEVRIEGVSARSLQADRAVCHALERAGAGIVSEPDAATAIRRPLRAFRFDATDCPDLFPALTALASAADGVSELRGVHRLRDKESDRARTLCEEYGRLGIAVELTSDDTMLVRGGPVRAARVSAHADHRIAMSLAAAALRADGPVVIEGAQCVGKSYPSFFDDLDKIRIS